MAVKNKMHINELNPAFFKENYKIKKNVTEVELMETIENLSDGSTSNNESYDDNSSKKITEKTNEKLKKINNKNKSDENKERKIYYSNIPQIYETYETSIKDEYQMANNNENQETSIISNVIATLYIIIAVVILLHMHLNEDHIIIKTISTLKLKYVNLIKSISIFSNLMNTVTITNTKIDIFLDLLKEKSAITKPYIESLKELNTEFSVLFIVLILLFFTATFILHIMHSIMTMKMAKDSLERNSIIYVTNRMTMDEYEDKTFTYSELAKLHDDKDYISLKNKRAGEGIESWNWQIRKLNKNTGKDICSDIELSSGEEN
ncbi:conserved Plasmodium protein, unknown function [Plasmodium chabaudi adami]|uniref:Uncharacterized protein n=1 Tax=Plasmodium chabaudi adami TaxID=5826 RepID=A0A1D3LM84_PLACE|nr:conserved Plasmodium protein, unknown function [Plasmodium chabaudi adami]